MKPRYNENIELRMTDKSCLVYCINTDDFYKKNHQDRWYYKNMNSERDNPEQSGYIK